MSIWYHRSKTKLGRKKTDDDDDHQPCLKRQQLLSDIGSSHKEDQNYLVQLESRVHELESILREYFLDVDYLDAFRARTQETMDQHVTGQETEP